MEYRKTTRRKKPQFSPDRIAKYTKNTHAPFCCNACEYITDSPAALVMHHNRKHGKMVAPGQLAVSAPIVANGTHAPAPVEIRTKRKWTRRTNVETVALRREASVCFCPNCGTDIRKIQIAMNL